MAIVSILGAFSLTASLSSKVLGGEIIQYQIGLWKPPVGISLVVDPLALVMALIICLIGSLATIYSIRSMSKDTRLTQYYTLLCLFQAGMLGVVLTGDLFNLFVFLEIMAVSSYALVAFRREKEQIEAAIKYTVMSCLGTTCVLLGIAFLYGMYGQLNMAALALKIDSSMLPPVSSMALALLLLGFGIKAAFVPLHSWLPDAHPAAPSPVSAMLSGVMIKTGVYAMVRLSFTVYNLPSTLFIAYIGMITAIFGVSWAIVQSDVKRLLAYHSISQIGYILMGVGIGTTLGITGGLFHLVNHALFKALLFLCAGAVIYRTGTRDLNKLGGLMNKMPTTAIAFSVGALAISGVPPLNGFMSKWVIFWASIESGQILLAIVGALVSILTLASFLKVLRKAFFGKLPSNLSNVHDVPLLMIIPMIVLAIICVLFGILPDLGLNFVKPAADILLHQGVYIKSVLGG
jgi:multicomponent Na+:H+ antiporter subunit D